MPPSSGELWGLHLMPSQVDVDCFLPTGILVPLRCNRNATLESIKTDLWAEAKKFPFHTKLLNPTCYIFVSITQEAEREEFFDETRRLCDLRLFLPWLKVVEPEGNRDEKKLNYEIGMAVGISINDFNEMKELEVMTFRRNILEVCKEVVACRDDPGGHNRALYTYPPEVESSSIPPSHVQSKLNKESDHVIVCIWVLSDNDDRQKYSVKVPHTATPQLVIAEAIRRRTRSMKLTADQQQMCIRQFSNIYVLKVCGCNQYLLEEHPLSQYKYIRECIAREKIPQLMLQAKEAVYTAIPENIFRMPTYVQKGVQALRDIDKQETIPIWTINTKLRIKINSAAYVNVKGEGKIYVKTGLYHGTELLCPTKETECVDSLNPRWNQWLEYDILVSEIPRSARLCLSICSVAKRRKTKEEITVKGKDGIRKKGERREKFDYALAWGNLQMFDFNHRLLSDKGRIHLWPMPQGMDDLLNPIGIPGSNPNQDCPCLDIEFDKFSHSVTFDMEKFDEYCRRNSQDGYTQDSYVEHRPPDEKQMKQLEELVSRDPLSELSEQEKDFVWKLRNTCLVLPHSLPKLLNSVKWNDRGDVAEIYRLLQKWPTLSPEDALELLDCSYMDTNIRNFAVDCLNKGLTNDKLSQYLLQIVQALKYEPYLDNCLTRFLLKRALLNQRIGQFFFWHLRSEMHETSIRLRFGLILEAYCRGCGAFLRNLLKQLEALDKLAKLSDKMKSDFMREEDQKRFLTEQLSQADYQEALQRFISPLNNSHMLGDILVQHCYLKSSKKRPLWLVWQNPDPLAEYWLSYYKLIFKNGDDLRQDMLTLQVIRIMDSIWKNEGIDLRMIPYGCLSTGKEMGLIEVVPAAKTVMAIQHRGGKAASMQLDSSQLHKWIRERNPKEQYDVAIDTFTKSCAGYCVATFVLGIGDRHSENIMLTEEGQVFHIDFGHFLNHKKKKFGINRERVPFVLTEDFIKVIAKGADQPQKNKLFEEFQELCGTAYLALRKHAKLFITLFTLMLSCSIPELQSLDDIGYLRKTLAVEKSEQEAATYFQEQFSNAYGGSWTTKLDWFFHYLNNRNR